MTREKRKELIEHLQYSLSIDADYLLSDEDVEEIIKALEEATNIGHWIDGFGGCRCSECGWVEAGYSNYCPTCGAKMAESEVKDADSN